MSPQRACWNGPWNMSVEMLPIAGGLKELRRETYIDHNDRAFASWVYRILRLPLLHNNEIENGAGFWNERPCCDTC